MCVVSSHKSMIAWKGRIAHISSTCVVVATRIADCLFKILPVACIQFTDVHWERLHLLSITWSAVISIHNEVFKLKNEEKFRLKAISSPMIIHVNLFVYKMGFVCICMSGFGLSYVCAQIPSGNMSMCDWGSTQLHFYINPTNQILHLWSLIIQLQHMLYLIIGKLYHARNLDFGLFLG